MDKVQLETLLKENPAAMAAVQKMTAIKLQGKGKRKVQATTALKDKEHPSHTKAVGIFQKLKDMLSKEKKNEPEFKDYTPTQSDTDFYRKQYAGRTGKELGEDRMQEMTSKTKRDMENSFETSEDLDDFITKHQSEIPKNQWRKIDNYLDDIRDEEQGMKSSGWADPAKKGLKKILTRYIKESINERVDFHTITGNKRFMTKTALPIIRKYGAKKVKVNLVGGDYLEVRFPIDSNKLKKLDKELKRKNKTAYGGIVENRRDKMTEDILRKVIREEIRKIVEEDDAKSAFTAPIPHAIERYMKKFIEAMNQKNLNRRRKLAILGRVVVGLHLDPQEVTKYARLVKREI
jgi:hypothetical protein